MLQKPLSLHLTQGRWCGKVDPLLTTAHPLTQGCGVRARVKGIRFSLHLHNPAPKITTDNWLGHWLPALHWPYDHWLSRIVSQSVEAYSGEWIDSCYLCYLSYTLDYLAHPLRGYLYLFTAKTMNQSYPEHVTQFLSMQHVSLLTLPAYPTLPSLPSSPYFLFYITMYMEMGYRVTYLEYEQIFLPKTILEYTMFGYIHLHFISLYIQYEFFSFPAWIKMYLLYFY